MEQTGKHGREAEVTKILLAEDEKTQREELEEALVSAGFQVDTAPDGIAAISMVKARKYDMVLTDMRMPAPKGVGDDECGLAVLKATKEWHPETEVIIFTYYATAKTVRLADSYNVYKYVDKPININDLIKDINSALKLHSESNFIAVSESMRAIVADVLKIAKTSATILLLGETGSGKDELAKFIHANSGRPADKFVTINTTAIPKELFETELFGYAPKSGISGANPKGKPGLVEEADGGTLFLNEIGDMDLESQRKLLDFLESKSFRRIGETKLSSLKDLRVIAATNKNLEDAIREGHFRRDLFYRLNLVKYELPPLREQKEEIKPLSELFLKDFQKRYRKYDLGRVDEHALKVDDEVWKRFQKYDWYGNVRELRNVIERIVLTTLGTQILPEHLPKEFFGKTTSDISLPPVEVDDVTKALLLALEKVTQNQPQISPAELEKLMMKFLPEGSKPPSPKMIGRMINKEFGVKSKRGGRLGRYLYTISHEDVIAKIHSHHLDF